MSRHGSGDRTLDEATCEQLAVELHYWEDLGMEEVAAVLDVPVGTAKSRLRRAKELLVDGMQRESGSLVVTQDDLGGWAHELRWFLERTGSPRG